MSSRPAPLGRAPLGPEPSLAPLFLARRRRTALRDPRGMIYDCNRASAAGGRAVNGDASSANEPKTEDRVHRHDAGSDVVTAFKEFDLRMRPELAAGGFARDDGSLAFYIRIDALIRPDMVVLDLGAGRGAQLETDSYLRRYNWLRGRVAKLVGVDVDPIVLTNPGLDEAIVIDPAKPLPFPDNSFDLIYSDWVLEHIPDPSAFAAEVERVLKPGCWFCARTPNRWGYVAMAARLSPAKLQDGLLKSVQPGRLEQDVFPKYYRLNTLSTLARYFPPSRFRDASYTHNPRPSYHGGRAWMFRLVELFQSVPIKALDTVIFAFLQKSDSNASSHAGRPKV